MASLDVFYTSIPNFAYIAIIWLCFTCFLVHFSLVFWTYTVFFTSILCVFYEENKKEMTAYKKRARLHVVESWRRQELESKTNLTLCDYVIQDRWFWFSVIPARTYILFGLWRSRNATDQSGLITEQKPCKNQSISGFWCLSGITAYDYHRIKKKRKHTRKEFDFTSLRVGAYKRKS